MLTTISILWVMSAGAATSLAMPPPPKGTHVLEKALRVAVMDTQTQGEIPPRPLAFFRQALAPEIRKLDGVSAISSSEVRDMLSLERQKQLVGCADEASACLIEIAGALDADELVTTEIVLLGKTYALSARRLSMKQAKVVQSYTRKIDRADGEELVAAIGPMVAALYPERPLKRGRVRGVEAEVARRLNPPPLPRWATLGTAGAAVVALAVGGTFGYLANDAATQFHAAANRAQTDVLAASELVSLQQQAQQRAQTANILFLSAGVIGVGAGVAALFTDWRDDRSTLSVQPVLGGGGGGVSVSGRF